MLPALEAVAAFAVATALPLVGMAMAIIAWWLLTDDDGGCDAEIARDKSRGSH